VTGTLDELDQRIVDWLRVDGRRGLRDMAVEAGVQESTISARIRRLSDEGILTVTAVVDMAAAGYPYQVFCFIRVSGRPVEEVATDIADIDEVLALFVTYGEFDLIAELRARDLEHLGRLVHHHLGAVAGVDAVETDLCVDIHRYSPDLAALR
jgi:Lrp/AsnC family transcriptional regulator, regulator for asnA, asnC and gidA